MRLHSNHELYSEVLQEANGNNTLTHCTGTVCSVSVWFFYWQAFSIVYFNSCHKYWGNIDRDVGIKSNVNLQWPSEDKKDAQEISSLGN